jgi:hypothetical protein
MIDFEAVTRQFGSQAVVLQLADADIDRKAVAIMKASTDPDRIGVLRG